MKAENKKSNIIARPPVVCVMGHVDHGKSTLLDYIRKSNTVGGEAGGITQHISAYEVSHKSEDGVEKMITFLDTPGHEAFSKMRARGAVASDIAILVVSAEDGIKAQTLEAYNTIVESKIPYIVAINKIDRPNANIEKVKMELVEKGMYLEGMGGDIPYVAISAKEGTGVNELLDMILLVSMVHESTGDTAENASGVIIEANREPKRGISATAIIKNGTLTSGMYIACGEAIVTTRILENFIGKPVKEATFSSPIRLVGFECMPEVGNVFNSFKTKKEAEAYVNEIKNARLSNKVDSDNTVQTGKVIPLVIKTDVAGTIEALEKEIQKLNTEEISFKILNKGVGAINESDLKTASVNKETIIIGFNTKIDSGARDMNESLKVEIQIFDIIYKLIDWLKEIVEARRPRQEVMEVTGTLKVLKTFNGTKDKQVIGGKVITGRITDHGIVRIVRRDFEIGRGKIIGLQQNKLKSKEILEGTDCGVSIEAKVDIAAGDILEAFITVVK